METDEKYDGKKITLDSIAERNRELYLERVKRYRTLYGLK